MKVLWMDYWLNTGRKILEHWQHLQRQNRGSPLIIQNITRNDFDRRLKINKSDKIYIPLNSISDTVVNHLKRIAAFKNPEFYSKQAMRISTYNVPRIICRADFTDEYIVMPRGCEDAITAMLSSLGVTYEIVDRTNQGKHIAVAFKGKEREEQLNAINTLMAHTNGVLSSNNRFWKNRNGSSN